MLKMIVGILASIALLAGLSLYELSFVERSFANLHDGFFQMYLKTEEEIATAEDANAVRLVWQDKKQHLHFWLPHAVIDQIDTQLGEALGYLYEENYMDALPKWQVLLTLTENIPQTYSLLPENIF